MNISASSLSLPPHVRQRLIAAETRIPEIFAGAGNAFLLDRPLLALIASRSCPGSIILQTIERVPQWIAAGKVIISGFHSPLEQQALRSILRRNGRVIKVLARGLISYRTIFFEEREALEEGTMLVISAFPPTVPRTTRATALERNRLVLALATEHYIPWLSHDSPLQDLLGSSCILTKCREKCRE